jgi:hypothetical protein
MLIIFVLALLALLAVCALVFALPCMLVVRAARARHRRSAQKAGLTPDPDSAFLDMINREWPPDADPRIA